MSAQRRTGLLRGLIIVGLTAVWLVIGAIGGQSIGTLSSVTTNDQETFLPREAESVTAKEALTEFDDTGALPAFVVLLGDGLVDEALGQDGPPTGPPGREFAAKLLDGVEVDGTPLADYLIDDQPAVVIGAEDESGVMVFVPLDADRMEQQTDTGGNTRDLVIDALRDQAGEVTGADEVHVTGPAGFTRDLGAAFAGIDGLLLLVACAAVFVILLIVYRSVIVPLMVLTSSVCGLALAGWVVHWLAERGTLVLNGQAQGILFILVVGAGTDYGLLLVARYREELIRRDSPLAAMRMAWRACVEPILASAGTVVLGLLCLLLADLNSSRSLGPVGAIGIGAALLAALTFLPALLLLGRWIFWPRVPRALPAHGKPAEPKHRGLWVRVADLVQAHPRRLWLIVVAVLALGCVAVPTFEAKGTSQAEVFLIKVDSVTGQEILDDRFETGAADPIRVVTPTGKADDVVEATRDLPGVADSTLGEKEIDGRVVVDVVPEHPEEAEDVVVEVREAVHPLAPGEILVGGNQAVRVDSSNTATRDLTVVIPAVLAVVLLVLTMLLRSVVAALVLTAATVLSFGTTLGVAALVFNHVFDFPGADPTVPLFGFVFLVALGVDYSIFLMSRIREEVGATDQAIGVRRGLTSTGGVITSAGLVLAATFAALAVIPLLFLAQIAFIVAFGVLLDTLVVRSLLVSSLSVDLGRRIWWPSRLSRRPVEERAPEPAATD